MDTMKGKRRERRELSTTGDTEDRRLDRKDHASFLRVPRVLCGGERNSATRSLGFAVFAVFAFIVISVSIRAQQYPSDEEVNTQATGVDLSGEWTPVREEDNTGNTELGDWVGIPMNEAARLRAMAWVASIQTLPEWQCRPHAVSYISRGPSQVRISKEVDPVSRQVIAWHMEWLRSIDKAVYMDGRPHPSDNAPHTWGGFSTGQWIGDMLKIETTHIKEEYLKRDGVFHSDRIKVNQFLIRRGNYLTYILVEYDPVYLTEALIRSTEYQIDAHQNIPPYPCNVVEEVDRARGIVPHNMPGTQQYVDDVKDYANRYNIPWDVITAGAETMYPEIQAKIAAGRARK